MAVHEHLFDVQEAKRYSKPRTAATRSSTSPRPRGFGSTSSSRPSPTASSRTRTTRSTSSSGPRDAPGRRRGDRPHRGPGNVRRGARGASLHRLRVAEPARHLHPRRAGLTGCVSSTPRRSPLVRVRGRLLDPRLGEPSRPCRPPDRAGRRPDECLRDAAEQELGDSPAPAPTRPRSGRSRPRQPPGRSPGRVPVLHQHLGLEAPLPEIFVRASDVLVRVGPQADMTAGLDPRASGGTTLKIASVPVSLTSSAASASAFSLCLKPS